MPVSQSYKKWYERHKEEHNERRRARYQSDAEYRSRIQTASRAHRQKNKSVKPEKTVFTIGEAAAQVKRDVTTLNQWEKKGYIPNTKGKQGYRIYTPHQIKLMAAFSSFLRALDLKGVPVKHSSEYKDVVQEQATTLKEQWHGCEN